jgi:glyoxylase-like metal-dependent hydrolase (beta-lactamase superfamily II)
MSLGKLLKYAALTVVAVLLLAVSGVVYLLMFGGPPMENGATIADGKVMLVVDRMGPVRVGIHVVLLAEGGHALVDAGMDPSAKAVIATLEEKRSAGANDVKAIFITHAHDDHAGGAVAFQDAQIYAMEPDASALARAGHKVHALADGEKVTVRGTTVEAFALPGHTAGSAAYLIEGVLFLGDAAAAISETEIGPNDFAYTVDVAQNHRSLRALAARLEPRRDEVRYLAFGHQGQVENLQPLLDWAAKPETR